MSLIYIQGEEEKRKRVHYEVDMTLPPLGEGGMGQVRRGVRVDEKTGLRQDVAIKFLFEDLPTHAIERARREASIQIHNENLVEMFGFIEIEQESAKGHKPVKRYHVVSELLDGVMLFDLLHGKVCDRNGNEIAFAKELYTQYQNDKFSFAIFLVKNILSGLMALHDKGYIHRDLDPSNIMITSDKKVKIIDFGIAKQLNNLNTQDQQLTSTGQFIGKAAYAAPELVLGDVHHQDKTTDIYSVGIMLYQFIVGSMPFEGTMAELIDKQLHEKIPLKLVPYKAIRNIIGKATEKKQVNRYQSAAEMRVDLEHLTKNDAVPSKTAIENVSELLSNKYGNKKNITIFSAVAVVLVLIGASVLFMGKFSGPSEEELEKARLDSLYQVRNGAVIDSPEESISIDVETGAKMKPVGYLLAEALKNLQDTTKVQEGISQLTEITEKYKTYKSTAKAMALLSALLQPLDATYNPIEVKLLRQRTSKDIQRDATKAHRIAEEAVKLDETCYQALYELATDYVAGEIRTGNANIYDVQKALKLYESGIKYARKQNNTEYIELFQSRIEQVRAIIK